MKMKDVSILCKSLVKCKKIKDCFKIKNFLPSYIPERSLGCRLDCTLHGEEEVARLGSLGLVLLGRQAAHFENSRDSRGGDYFSGVGVGLGLACFNGGLMK